MKNFTFAVDIDETLASVFLDNEILDTYFHKFGQKISVDDLTDYWFENFPGLLEIYIDYLDRNHDNLPLFVNAKEVLTNLKNSGNRLLIITSREKHYQNWTIKFIENTFWKNFFDKIIFTSNYEKDDKSSLANREKCDFVIDDASHHISAYLENTNATIIKMDAPWNRDFPDSDRIISVNNWREVENFFQNYQK